MTLHMIKLSVGTEDVDDLERWQAQRLRRTGRVFHKTRMMPRRRAELIRGGSIYWVIKGAIRCRQRLTAIEAGVDLARLAEAGRMICQHLGRPPASNVARALAGKAAA